MPTLTSMMRSQEVDIRAAATLEGDRSALRADFDELYQKHAPFVWRTLRSLGVSQSDADDATQEVFVTVFRKLGSFEGRSSLRTWLCGIAVGMAKNFSRKTKRRDAANRALPRSGTSTPNEETEALDFATRCLGDLEEPLRMVFVLAELEQLTAPEIAEVLALNVNTVYSRLRIARDQFEASVARHGGWR